jgi:UDP-N-acetyl-D-galactosamine dehydrogenase
VTVVGLGYVGLSLAVGLARRFVTVGVDIDSQRIADLTAGSDHNAMHSTSELFQSNLRFTTDSDALDAADVIIVAVPTPVDAANHPDLSAMRSVCRMVAAHLRPDSIVVFESTVYPGCTEEECVPLLEQGSGLTAHQDFGVAYSPERIDPGDRSHGLAGVVKVVAGGDPATRDVVAGMYGEIITAGIHVAPNIRTAEAAKVIENVQRDLNIALMNELSMLFHTMGIKTSDVLEAAGTKWNFAAYHPGLVGGHCIPVDPFYLVHKARELGHEPQVILSGRRVNDGMAAYVADSATSMLRAKGKDPKGARALVLGVTFKEDVPDIRNAQALNLIEELKQRGLTVTASDPIVSAARYSEPASDDPFAAGERFDMVVLAVPHGHYRTVSADQYIGLFDDPTVGVFVDLRGVFDEATFTEVGLDYWVL